MHQTNVDNLSDHNDSYTTSYHKYNYIHINCSSKHGEKHRENRKTNECIDNTLYTNHHTLTFFHPFLILLQCFLHRFAEYSTHFDLQLVEASRQKT